MKKYKILIIALIIYFPSVLFSYDSATHLYLGYKMFDTWRGIDSTFWQYVTNVPNTNSPNFKTWALTINGYLIGLTLPDLLTTEGQSTAAGIVNGLYDYRDDFSGPLHITDETYNQVQTGINWIDFDPNFNLSKLTDMVRYVQNHNYTSLEKSLIYGAYFHVVQDQYAGMVLRPSNYGFGLAVESDSAVSGTNLSSLI